MSDQLESKRFRMTLIGFAGVIFCAFLKHFFKGLDTSLVFTAAGLIAGYCGMESWRPSSTGKTNG